MSIALDSGIRYDVLPVSKELPPIAVPLSEADDILLVAHAGTGDMAAFEQLVWRYRNDVYAMSYHFLHNREDAWDCAQEVFVKTHRNLGRFRGDGSFKGWLLRITANHAKDKLKKRRLSTVSFDDALKTDTTADQPDPARSLEMSELGQAIESALDELPAKHKDAFVLREYQGLSYQEMAEVMKCSVGTVMSRLHYARKKLQHALIEMGVAEGGQHV
jgi:RNA polymerase sigma-70 factor (ECF subfamily)